MIEVTVTIYTCAGASHEVRADVEKLGPGQYEVEWCDVAAMRDLCLTPSQTHYLVRRCEEAYDVVQREREALGIAGLLDDTEPLFSAERDYRTLTGCELAGGLF